jgi:hypothetical protein
MASIAPPSSLRICWRLQHTRLPCADLDTWLLKNLLTAGTSGLAGGMCKIAEVHLLLVIRMAVSRSAIWLFSATVLVSTAILLAVLSFIRAS